MRLDTISTFVHFLHSTQYYNKVKALRPTARFPDAKAKATGGQSDGRYIYYSKKGFGEDSHMDHTKPSSRGGYWVGTAPLMGGHETISATSSKGGRFEFQTRNASFGMWQGGLTGLIS